MGAFNARPPPVVAIQKASLKSIRAPGAPRAALAVAGSTPSSRARDEVTAMAQLHNRLGLAPPEISVPNPTCKP